MTRETTGDCRDHWGLRIRQGRLLETSRETTGDCWDTGDLKYSEVDCYRPVETKETAGTTGDLVFSEVGC